MLKGYVWGIQGAEKKNKKGRARGKMVMEIKKELLEKATKMEEEGERIMLRRVRVERDSCRIVGVYMRNENWDGIMGKLER